MTVKIQDKDKLFFTADNHFGHKNVIKFSNRPFANIETMDDAMIRNWNSKVPKDGIVYHLGDFSFYKQDYSKWILSQLNGRIILIKGNHDKNPSYFKEYKDYEVLKVKDEDSKSFQGNSYIVLSHFPFAIWDRKHYGSICLHGHSHGNYKIYNHEVDNKQRIVDVGVDCWNYTPVSYQEIIDKLS